jgi:serine/threonine protein kinase
VVYRATSHNGKGRVEALKVVDLRKASGRRGVDGRARIKRLREEIPIISRLNHANIVHLYWSGESNGHPFFVMEFCPGGNLHDHLAGKPMGPKAAARLVKTLAEAMDSVHRFGVLHRDLKPSNVLFTEEGVAKIADFGLAMLISAGELAAASRDIVGTPAYMAPEQVDSSLGKPDATIDVYGLGAILYECLTARPPFRSGPIVEVLHCVIHEPPIPPRRLNTQVPLDLEAICLKCLRKDPEKRYLNALALAEDLDRFLADAPVHARRQSIVRLACHWVKTNRVLVLVLTVLLIAGGAYVKIHWDALQRELQQHEIADRERRETEALRSLAHTESVTSAVQSSRQGDWVRALPHFNSAIDDGMADALRLRVDRLTGYFALNRTADLVAELDALEQAELGTLVAQVKLIRAAWLLCDWDKQAEGRALARAALANRQQLFSDADVAFAEGLASERVGQAVRAFKRAVDADPLHYLAASSYAVALAAVGERDEARRQARFLRNVFSYSPVADLAESIIDLLEGQRGELKKHLEAASKKLPAYRKSAAVRLEEFLLLILDIQDISFQHIGSREGPNWFDLRQPGPLLARAKKLIHIPNPEPLILPIPAVGLYQTRLLELFSAYIELRGIVNSMQSGKQEGALRRIQAILDDYEEAGLLLMAATIHYTEALSPLNSGDVEGARVPLAKAAEMCERSLKAPSIMTRAMPPYFAHVMEAITHTAILKLVRQPKPIHFKRLYQTLPPLVDAGSELKKLRQEGIGFVLQMITAPLTRAQCVQWELGTPAGKSAFEKRNKELAAFGQQILSNWERDEPDNKSIPRLREDLAKWAASSGVLEP